MVDADGTLGTPLIVINHKVYPQGIGDRAVELARALEETAESYPEATVALAPSHPDLGPVREATALPVLAQHVDGDRPGSGTGKVLPESLVDLGVDGSLVNHAERQVPRKAAEAAVERLTEAGLTSIVCAEDEGVVREVAAFEPPFVAMEPPELIGGDVSVTSADPGIVEDSVAAAAEVSDEVTVLCGAGVKSGEDVATALELGTEGVLVASGVVKADDPGAALADLLDGAVGRA